MPATPSILAGQRWVVVADSPMLPASDGGRRENLGLLRAAAQRGLVACVVVPCSGGLDAAAYREEIGEVPLLASRRRTSGWAVLAPTLPAAVAVRPSPGARLVREAAAYAEGATGIVLMSHKSRRVGQRLATALGLPVVLRLHNREGDYARDAAGATRGALRWLRELDALRVAADERALGHADWLAGIADISRLDAEDRRAAGCRVPLAVVPPFAARLDEPPPPRVPDVQRPEVLFLAALDVPANGAAVGWLLDRVWPRVAREVPGAQLVVAGRSPGAGVRARVAATPAARLLADVPSTGPLLARASVAVNPAVAGSGINIKLVDSLVAAVPTVSTSRSVRALGLRDGEGPLVADHPAGFADAIVTMLRDPAGAERRGHEGRSAAMRVLDPEAGLVTLASLLHPPPRSA